MTLVIYHENEVVELAFNVGTTVLQWDIFYTLLFQINVLINIDVGKPIHIQGELKKHISG